MLVTSAQGAKRKVEEGNVHSARGEFAVGLAVGDMAIETDLDTLTEQQIELTARLAWALSELPLAVAPGSGTNLER